ncbi:DUF29 domain-containing protein [Massilia sp. GCM10020059]|uniref:DUF29 domain-containing protein n=1 Tax=Massilia agrisoli TaxID=2892444 RepID=A0ABS8IUR6_9BURK|nr:DUF29 domain-containing protein [Massilia agrisoli]MCC6071547.1 DUF29 domain-containing protein [Massilia agrisoli]
MNDPKIPSPVVAAPGYEDDLVAWMENQIGLLRAHKFESLDLENLLEELEGMVRHERRGLRSRVELVLVHLLKHQFQPPRRSRSWLLTLDEQRNKIADRIEDSPSLRRELQGYMDSRYTRAVETASLQTRRPASDFPTTCPYAVEQLLDKDFLP